MVCATCASRGDDALKSDRGLRPGQGWNASIGQGPIGAIGGTTPPQGASPEIPPVSRAVGDPYYAAPYPYSYQGLEQPALESYDWPPWGVGAAICVWLASVAAILILPNISVLAWLLYQRGRGRVIPADRDQLEKLFAQPQVVFIVVLSTVVAHLITLAIIWAVVTSLGRRSVWQAPEWRWNWSNPVARFLFVVGIVFMMFAAEVVLSNLLPESKETDFDRLVKNAGNVRILIAFLAVFTAPLVEEWVYRGVLYGGLRRVAGTLPSVLIVSLLFAGVHFPQYWGAWAGLVSISLLSLTLTIIRAATKSLLPCIAVHVLFNAISSLVILSRHY